MENSEEETSDLRQSILTNDLGDTMLRTVAPIYDKSKAALYLFQALGTVLQKETDFVAVDFIKQMFPQTTTWGMKFWEDEYGIVTDTSKGIEQRRSYLISVMYKKRPMTPKRIKQIVKGITGYDSDVIENVADNTILINVYGYVLNLKQLTDELDRKIPAHLNYILRISEIDNNSIITSGFVVTEFEHYEIDVFSSDEDRIIAITSTGFALTEHEKIELEVSQ